MRKAVVLASDVETRSSDLDDMFGVIRMPRAVLFGSGERREIGRAVRSVGRSALVCTDAFLAGTRHFAQVLEDLRDAGVSVQTFADTEPELPVSTVQDCLQSVRTDTVDVVVGYGGGSCLDLAKVVSVLLSHGGDPKDYYGEFAVPAPVLPIVAVPTTAGTGSEATPVAVLSDPDRAIKVGISDPHLIPEIAVCDPELTRSCPATVTAAAGIDALSHLVESFTAIRHAAHDGLWRDRVFVGKTHFTDQVALAGLKRMSRSLLSAHQEPGDMSARQDVMFGAFAGGLSLGTAGTAAAHALQYPIGTLTGTPHGVGIGVLLPYVVRYNLPVRVAEFARIGRVMGASEAGASDVDAAVSAVRAIDALVDGLKLPRALPELGVRETDLDWVAKTAMSATRLVQNNPRELDVDSAMKIARSAFTGDRKIPNVGRV